MNKYFAVMVWWLGVIGAMFVIGSSVFLAVHGVMDAWDVVFMTPITAIQCFFAMGIAYLLGGTFWKPPQIAQQNI